LFLLQYVMPGNNKLQHLGPYILYLIFYIKIKKKENNNNSTGYT
jgi:hypothetical protein